MHESSTEADHAPTVRAQLERIVRSADFARSPRLKRFLEYVVEQQLTGCGERLKAYSIALAVFDRPATFDPQSDPLVRIEAARLRRALERYYLTEGRGDPVRITIPKGGYVPRFANSSAPDAATQAVSPDEGRAPAEPSRTDGGSLKGFRLALVAVALMMVGGAATYLATLAMAPRLSGRPTQDVPSIAILPFKFVGADERGRLLADGMADAIIDQVVRFSDVRVLGRETTMLVQRGDDAAETLKRFDVRYFVEGTVSSTQSRAAVSVRLVNVDKRQIVWSSQTYIDTTEDALKTQIEIATQFAGALGQPYGAVFRIEAMRSQKRPPEDWDAYTCTLNFYSYRAKISPKSYQGISDCLKETVSAHPDYATGWAMLAVLTLDEIRVGFNSSENQASIIARANAAAEMAVRFEPENVRALQALMMARFFASDVAGGREAGERALRINHHDSELLGEYGARIGQAGDWERGIALMNSALAQNPGNADYYRAMIAFQQLMSGQTEAAAANLNVVNAPNLAPYPLFHFIAMLIAAEQGRMQDAIKSLATFSAMQPAFIRHLDSELKIRNLRQEDGARIKAILARVQSEAERQARLVR